MTPTGTPRSKGRKPTEVSKFGKVKPKDHRTVDLSGWKQAVDDLQKRNHDLFSELQDERERSATIQDYAAKTANRAMTAEEKLSHLQGLVDKQAVALSNYESSLPKMNDTFEEIMGQNENLKGKLFHSRNLAKELHEASSKDKARHEGIMQEAREMEQQFQAMQKRLVEVEHYAEQYKVQNQELEKVVQGYQAQMENAQHIYQQEKSNAQQLALSSSNAVSYTHLRAHET